MENGTWTNNSIVDSTLTKTLTATIFFLPLCFVSFILNLLALVLLKRSKKLHGNRFYCLVLCLSTSDILASLSSLVIVFQMFLQMQNITVPYICFSATLTVSITITFSFVQVLIICVERLLAILYTNKTKKWTKQFTYLYALSFFCTVVLAVCICFSYGNVLSTSCKLENIFQETYWIFQITMASVRGTIYCAIVVVYVIILWYLQKRMAKVAPSTDGKKRSNNIELKTNSKPIGNRTEEHKKTWTTTKTSQVPNKMGDRRQSYATPSTSGKRPEMHLSVTNLEEPHFSKSHRRTAATTDNFNTIKMLENKTRLFSWRSLQKSSKRSCSESSTTKKTKTSDMSEFRIKRFQNSMVTVGIIIIVISISVLPVVITNLISVITDGDVVSQKVLEFINAMVILNPLFDPIVYVLRLKEFRNMLKCRC